MKLSNCFRGRQFLLSPRQILPIDNVKQEKCFCIININRVICLVHASPPQGTVLPESLALQFLLSVIPSHLTISSSLRADDRHLLLELSQSSRPQHVSGALTHSFPGLRRRGVPQVITVEATAPRGQEQAGLLSVRAGTCFIRANRFTVTKGGQWLWALESKCPLMQVLQLLSGMFTISLFLT